MKIRVAAHDYVLEHKSKEWSTDGEQFGMCDREQLILKIVDPSLCAWDRYLETIVHEVGHAIFYEYHIGQLEAHGAIASLEEHINSLMSTGWFQVLRDNPQLILLLQSLAPKEAQ